jgi:hypothetical protein
MNKKITNRKNLHTAGFADRWRPALRFSYYSTYVFSQFYFCDYKYVQSTEHLNIHFGLSTASYVKGISTNIEL